MSRDATTCSDRGPIDSAVATGKGDDGTTGLLFGGERIRKDDLRTEAYGTIDEAVAALGLARAELAIKGQYGILNAALAGLARLILRIQRELFVVGAGAGDEPRRLGPARSTARPASPQAMVDGVETVLARLEAAS